MTTTSQTMEANNLFSAVKCWRQRLSARVKNVFDRLAEARREKHRQQLAEEAQRCEEMLELRDRLRNRLHERLKEK